MIDSCGQRTGRGRRVQGDRRVHENQTERGRDVYKNCEQEDVSVYKENQVVMLFPVLVTAIQS